MTDTKPKHETIRFMGGVILQVDHEARTCAIRFDTRAPKQFYGRDSTRRCIQAAKEYATKKFPGYEIAEQTNTFLYGAPGEDD